MKKTNERIKMDEIYFEASKLKGKNIDSIDETYKQFYKNIVKFEDEIVVFLDYIRLGFKYDSKTNIIENNKDSITIFGKSYYDLTS